jgi:hypothetical protein
LEMGVSQTICLGFKLQPSQSQLQVIRIIGMSLFFVCFGLVLVCSTGDCTQGLMLSRQTLYHLNHT